MPKKKGRKAYEKGAKLENRIARWSKTQFGYESKAYKIKRTHVTKLVESARDVKDAYDEDVEDRSPNILMLVSDKGYDVDAIGMAYKYCIYCVKAGRTFELVGKMDRDDFENQEGSEY